MSNNRLWLFNPVTKERALIAKNLGGWGQRVMGDFDDLLNDAIRRGEPIELRIEHDDFGGSISGIKELPPATTLRSGSDEEAQTGAANQSANPSFSGFAVRGESL